MGEIPADVVIHTTPKENEIGMVIADDLGSVIESNLVSTNDVELEFLVSNSPDYIEFVVQVVKSAASPKLGCVLDIFQGETFTVKTVNAGLIQEWNARAELYNVKAGDLFLEVNGRKDVENALREEDVLNILVRQQVK